MASRDSTSLVKHKRAGWPQSAYLLIAFQEKLSEPVPDSGDPSGRILPSIAGLIVII